ncbi:MAG: zinc-finger domain-containing protein [Acidiferrobacterales bacterium]
MADMHGHGASRQAPNPKEIQANAQNRYEVSQADLPLHCPMEGMSLWNSHPRVYLPLEESREARCPYCGAVYVLKDE